ncbi:MAG: hypothetical protein Q8K69_01495 [Bacteroidota bacterium]|nr:hypothetical protein [Bacteroidota bacterium]MDP3432330.1 hypothetical protein [Bacteroidota bacterium]
MNIQVRKLNAIEYIIALKDEKVLSKIESAIVESQKREIKPFTQKQLIERAKLANKDYLAGRYKTQDQLETESENW